jgi:hypothetical protein
MRFMLLSLVDGQNAILPIIRRDDGERSRNGQGAHPPSRDVSPPSGG